MVSAAAASALSLFLALPWPFRRSSCALSNPNVADGGDREEAAGGQCR